MRERKRHIFDLVKPYLHNKSVNILDCGCGAGGFIIDFIKDNNNVVGVDISHNQLVKVIDLIHNPPALNRHSLHLQCVFVELSESDQSICKATVIDLGTIDR